MRRIIQRMVFLAIILSLSLVLLATVIGNSGNGDDEQDVEADQCNCAKNPAAAGSAVRLSRLINPNANRFKDCKNTDTNSSVQRAIVIYYPSHQQEYFFPEVRW